MFIVKLKVKTDREGQQAQGKKCTVAGDTGNDFISTSAETTSRCADRLHWSPICFVSPASLHCV